MNKTEMIKQYKRTKKGIATRIYQTQLLHSRKRKHPVPAYTLIELREWLLKQPNFDTLFDAWEKSNYKTDLKPSVDRIKNYLPYAFNNIRLVTWKENNEKGHEDIKNGKYITSQMKAVLQYDLNGNLIKEHYSMINASRQTKAQRSSIWKVCNNKAKTAGGFIWKYKEDNLQETKV